MADKLYKKLPEVLQTNAVKNFFESTVEQLYSESNVEVIKGYIGTRTSYDSNLSGAWVPHLNSVRDEYSLSPVVNTVNSNSGVSENFVFYDEFVSVLNDYGVNTTDQNLTFSEDFTTFIPPLDVDKLINFQEYYWDPDGPNAISIVGSVTNAIDVSIDVIGKTTFTPAGGKQFKNGMVIKFTGEYVVPASYVGTEYIVEGVGESISLVPKDDNFNTRFATAEFGQWDGTAFSLSNTSVVHSASSVTSVTVLTPGLGYVNPTVTVANVTGNYSNIATATATANAQGSITAVTATNTGTTHSYTGQIGLTISDTAVAPSIVEATTFPSGQDEVSTKIVTLSALTNVKAGQHVTFSTGTAIVSSISNNGIATHDFASDSFTRTPGEYRGVAITTSGSGTGATFDVIIDSGIATVNSISGANTNRVAGTYSNVSPQVVEDVLTTSEIEASVNGTIIGAFNSATVSYGVRDIVTHNSYYYRMLRSDYSSSNADWPVRPVSDAKSTSYWQLVPHVIPSSGTGATFDIAINGSGSATSVTANVTGNNYNVSERVNIDITSLGGATEQSGDLTFNVATLTGNVTNVTVNTPGSNYAASDTITIADTVLGGSLANVLTFDVATVSDSVTLADSITLSNADLTTSFVGTGFSARINTDSYSFTQDADGDVAVTITNSQAISGINPNDATDYYLTGGVYSFDKDTDGDSVGDSVWGGTLSQKTKDYTTLARGSANKNVWSRVNFWYHKNNYLDAGSSLPAKTKRASRPIFEFNKDIELINHGTKSRGTVLLSAGTNLISDLNGQSSNVFIDGSAIASGTTIVFPAETITKSQYVYQITVDTGNSTIAITPLPDPIDSTKNFTFADGDTIAIKTGSLGIGKEYYYSIAEGLVLAQEKITTNQAPLFKLYDDKKNYLGDTVLYPQSTFTGNKVFGLTESASITKDKEYKLPLEYKSFANSSEISFTNFIDTTPVSYTPFGSSNTSNIIGNYYYKLLKTDNEYHTNFINSNAKSTQRIVTRYNYTQTDVDAFVDEFNTGCVVDIDINNATGYNLQVLVNGLTRTDFAYSNSKIKFNNFTKLNAKDIIDISAFSSIGKTPSITSKSNFALPLSWEKNPFNKGITTIAEPEFLPHFKELLENQTNFVGDALNVNNFTNTAQESKHGTKLVKSNDDLMLSAFLLDDQPHNLVHALRFVSGEYTRYKRRLKSEISKHFNVVNFDNYTTEKLLETILRTIISYSSGKNVFTQTYILPFGDNYTTENITVNDIAQKVYTFVKNIDVTTLENSMLVYNVNGAVNTLLNVDTDYTITSTTPITITLTESYAPLAGDTIVAKFYNENRDSAQCPPTPSAMGMYPLYQPAIVTDTSFTTAKKVLIGHDGSKTPVWGDQRDNVLLEFENRIYNAAKKELRNANSHPILNIFNIRPGAFRDNVSQRDYTDLLNTDFSQWATENKVDHVVNEFYKEADEFSYNYRGTTTTPGYWKGWFEYYYDTIRPHTHPWEMLGFVDKPLWWDTTYGTTYALSNTTMWYDLEQGIIKSGQRENYIDKSYKISNPYRRLGLSNYLPINSSGTLLSPNDITTTGTTTKTVTYSNVTADSSIGFLTTSFLLADGLNVSFDSSNVYVRSSNIPNYVTTAIDTNANDYPIVQQNNDYAIPRITLSTQTAAPSQMGTSATAVLINGLPLYSPQDSTSYASQDVWHYNTGYATASDRASGIIAKTDVNGLVHTSVPTVTMATSDIWGTTNQHSGIIGWAFDGLPIYGPYGYTSYESNGNIADSTLTNIKSAFELRSGSRETGPGGAFTGQYAEDYTYNSGLNGAPGYTGSSGVGGLAKYNMRYGKTPESSSTPIYFYVATMDSQGHGMFPYAVGGGANATAYHPSATYGNMFFVSSPDSIDSGASNGYRNASATAAITSTSAITTTADSLLTNNQWKFGDGAPVENAWKHSEQYPYAIVEALLLNRPGYFATVFANPLNITTAPANKQLPVSLLTRKSWDFTNEADFIIHGEPNLETNTIKTAIGYTQFIKSWLNYQGVDITENFIKPLRSINTKLGHRFGGFIDKDTMILSLDQYSTTGTASNLILPDENIDVIVHNSPYKSRNFYSGAVIEKTATGYKVKGYDTNLGYFNILESDTTGKREKVYVGGEPAGFTKWKSGTAYDRNTIVRYNNKFYQAKGPVLSSATFVNAVWDRLPTLPMVNAASATHYQQTTGTIVRVDYGYEYTSIEALYDFVISLGRYNAQQGFDFGDFDKTINRANDWQFAGESLLFWTTGAWSVGNTLELSPAALGISFKPALGYVAELKKVNNNQFTILDREGKSINPAECLINRVGTTFEIIPPVGQEIYGLLLHTRETEHAMVIDNVTDFADTIFDSALNHKQERLKIKASRSANWDGRFLTEGFIINGSELIPNLDNLAQTMGRYYELGFIPVDKQVYTKSRELFGYTERDYLNELDINDDQQFDFYKGMIQSKGSTASLSRIGRSNAIVQGTMDIYDEWCLRIGDFGDVLNEQSVELKIEKKDIVQDPQLITLDFPQDTTGYVQKIDILVPKHQYFNIPEVSISMPAGSPAKQAKAITSLNSSGELSTITVTDGGSGYSYNASIRLNLLAGNLYVANTSTILTSVDATSSNAITSVQHFSGNSSVNASYSGSANITNLGSLIITDNITSTTATFNLGSITDVANVITSINENASINSTITAHLISNEIANSSPANTFTVYKSIRITGSDFTLTDNNSNVTLSNLNLTYGNFQPQQRFAIPVANNTIKANVIVTVGGTSTTAYDFDVGDRWQINSPSFISGNVTQVYTLNSGIVNSSSTMLAENIVTTNGEYSFVDVYVNGNKLTNDSSLYTANSTTVSFIDVGKLPGGNIEAGANIYVVEHATVDLQDSVQTDIPGKSVAIKVSTNDAIAIKLGQKRIYDITPDAKDDEVILIDIDDTARFLKKPSGVREHNLWPTTANVDYTGITDSKYTPIPNAGYVNRANVDFQAFGLSDLPVLFSDSVRFKPQANDFVHVGRSENRDWNVYKLEKANTSISFVEQTDNAVTSYLYTDYSLFNYVDSNQLQENDLSRYLDYNIAIKHADLSTNHVIWTNEQIVNKKAITISDWGGVAMIEANVTSIGPSAGAVKDIANITPAPTRTVFGQANVLTGGDVQIKTLTRNLINGDTVQFMSQSVIEHAYTLSGDAYVTDSQTSSLDNTSLSARTLNFSANDDLIYYQVQVAGANIDLRGLENTAIAGDPTTTFINGANIVLPATSLTSSAQSVQFTRVNSGKIKLSTSNINQHSANVTLIENLKVRLDTSNVSYANVITTISNVDSANNTITVDADFTNDDGNIVALGSTGWNITSFTVLEDIPLHGQSHTIANLTSTGFTVNQANVIANVSSSELQVTTFGKTKVEVTGHGLYSGEMVQVIANAYSGYYFVENASADTFVINTPYISSMPITGNVITKGITITTDAAHGITDGYAFGGKRVAVHMAEPRVYNQVYSVSSVTSGASNTIVINNAFAYATVANTMTEAVVTTIDHNKVTLNNATINVDNLNSEEAVVESFNRQQNIRRGFTVSSQFTLNFPMLKNMTNFSLNATGSHVGPYVSNHQLKSDPAITKNLQIAGQFTIPVKKISAQGFIKGAIINTIKATIKPTTPTSAVVPQQIAGVTGGLPISKQMMQQIYNGVGSSGIGSFGGIGGGIGIGALGSVLAGPVNFGPIAGSGAGFTIPTILPGHIPGTGQTQQTPPPPSGGNSGAPIIDPTKAVAGLAPKNCGPTNCPPVPASGGGTQTPGGSGGSTGPTCYTASAFSGGGWASINGVGHGDRRWGSKWSGYYSLAGKSGGSHTLNEAGLLGAVTYSDNGSRQSFTGTVTFVNNGTWYLHAMQFGRGRYNTSYVNISGATSGNGQVVGAWRRKNENFVNFRAGNVQAFTVTAGQTVTFSGQSQGGGNYWHGIAMHLSARADSFNKCDNGLVTNTGGSAGTTGNTPVDTTTTHREYVIQSANTFGLDDTWYFEVPGNGPAQLVFDMYSGADGLEIYQGTTKGAEHTLLSNTKSGNVYPASPMDKTDLISGSTHSSYTHNANNLTGFQLSGPTATGLGGEQIGVKYAGKITWNHDSTQGKYIKVFVRKPSSVYRFFIDLPKTPPAPLPQNPAPSQDCTIPIYDPNNTSGNGHTSNNNQPQTPVFLGHGQTTPVKTYPTGGPMGGSSGSGTNWHGNHWTNYGLPNKYGGGAVQFPHRQATYRQNYSGYGQPMLGGYIMLPSRLKTGNNTRTTTLPDGTQGQAQTKIVSTNNYGVYRALSSGRYVNTTVQKVTGGIVIPLATPMENRIPITPNPLRAVDVVNYPGTNYFGTGPRGLTRAGSTVLFDPKRISSTVGIGAYDDRIRNVLAEDYNLYSNTNNIDVLISDPSSGVVIWPMGDDMLIPDVGPKVITDPGIIDDTVIFNRNPSIILEPLTGGTRNPPATCQLNQPTPGITIDAGAMAPLLPGDNFYINGTDVRITGSTPESILHNIRCAAIKNNFTVINTFKNGQKAIRISSCTNAPITFRDGCLGGKFKEVLDFHVVRGFEQSVSDTANSTVVPATTGFGYGNHDAVGTSVTPSASYTLYNAEGVVTGVLPGGSTSTTTGKILTSRTTSRTTGGSGYTVGDRLRLVGGTPVAMPYGSVATICINDPGAGYSSKANIVITVGDGTTPGQGCVIKPAQIRLNAEMGIESIDVTVGGAGYHIDQAPTVTIIDKGRVGAMGNPDAQYRFRNASATAEIGTSEINNVPARVAKFEVTSVDAVGTVTSLAVIDRGIYKQFPADLTMGVPLEYDVVNLGDETGYENNDEDANFYQGTGLGQYNPVNSNGDLEELSSPGAYDPIAGLTGGGTGCRVFITAREIPDCTEKNGVTDKLGLPPIVSDTSFPEDMAACFNKALDGAGYDPEKVFIDYRDLNDQVGVIIPSFPGYDGVYIDESTPGFLDKLGIPIGTYNADMLCMEMRIRGSNTEDNRLSLVAEGTVLAIDDNIVASQTPDPIVIEIICVTSGGGTGDAGPGSDFQNGGQSNGNNIKTVNDPNSIFGDGTVNYVTDLYQYELRDIFGNTVNTLQTQQECDVLIYTSKRYDTEANITVANFDKVWVDNYSNTGWSYLESGAVKYKQEKLVDSKFVKNAIIYDADSGEKEYDLFEWDPFKGVIPGFIEQEIHYITESDPVVYNSSRTNFGRSQVGKVWWDTSTIAYTWYEQGVDSNNKPKNRERWLNWGKTMPGSAVSLFEWVESAVPPITYNGTGTPRSANFYIEESYPNSQGNYIKYYYFWVQNKAELDNEVAEKLDRQYNTVTLAKYLADPQGAGLPMISYVSDTSFIVHNIGHLLREDEQNLQINLSRNLNPVGNKHTAWKLLRENDNNSIIPEDLSLKLIDSLCSEDSIGNAVPDPLLSEVEKLGVAFRPRQTMFKDVKEARRLAVNTLNDILADIQLYSGYPQWDLAVPSTRSYIENTNWFAINRINNFNNSKIRYDNTFKPVYQVGSANELDTLFNIPNDSIVQVLASPTARFELWKKNGETQKFERITIENETIKFKDTLFTDDTNATLSSELRAVLIALKDNVFTNLDLWNKLFFTMMKYAYTEQKQLSWAFKTSYIYIEKEEEDLVQFKGYKSDNFSKVQEYLDEVKPYTSKIRDFKDGKKVPIEFMGSNSLSDFDKPPYADSTTASVRILDDFLQADSNIIQTTNAYTNYYSFSNVSGANSPIRKGNTTIRFDRVSWAMTAHDWNPAVSDGNTSIAVNIATLNAQTNAEVIANSHVTAAERIFKFDPAVRTQLYTDLNTKFGITDAETNVNIISNYSNINVAVQDGSLSSTLALIKTKVGGGFNGTLVDGNVFSKVVSGSDGTMTYQNAFGFDSMTYASAGFDPSIIVKNYIGSFTALPTLVVDDKITEGFDGITFLRVLYGEERPEEMVMLDPKENLIIRVTSNVYGNANVSSSPASSNASTVKYQINLDLFGKTSYLRLLQDGSANTHLTANLYTYSDSISVANVDALPKPLAAGTPGVVWVGSERIEYNRKVGNTLRDITRGTDGSTIQDWYITDPVTGDDVTVEAYDGSTNQIFNRAIPGNTVDFFYPEANIWLDTNAVSITDKGNASVSNSSSIMKFLHNL